MAPTVIVFGPTGNIGSFAATTAASHGAKVILAMRDTSKTVPGLSKAQESEGNYERVEADLTKPETLTAAVKSSGATRAFVYLAHGSRDHMKSALEALKSAGIEFVVFLSSFTIGPFDVDGEGRNVPQTEVIPWVHAQVEICLDEVFGQEHYVAVRPGAFATNLLRYKDGIAKGEVRLHGGDFRMDCITPIDMGRVSGTILAAQTGPKDGMGKVYLFGPQVLSMAEAIKVIAKVLGKEVNITPIGDEEGMEQMMANHFPKPIAEYMLRALSEPRDEKKTRPKYDEGVENVKAYTGESATSLEEWVKDNSELFGA